MRGNRTQCRQVKRCILFLIAITLLPLALVYFVVNDQLYRIKGLDVSIQPKKENAAHEHNHVYTRAAHAGN